MHTRTHTHTYTHTHTHMHFQAQQKPLKSRKEKVFTVEHSPACFSPSLPVAGERARDTETARARATSRTHCTAAQMRPPDSRQRGETRKRTQDAAPTPLPNDQQTTLCLACKTAAVSPGFARAAHGRPPLLPPPALPPPGSRSWRASPRPRRRSSSSSRARPRPSAARPPAARRPPRRARARSPRQSAPRTRRRRQRPRTSTRP